MKTDEAPARDTGPKLPRPPAQSEDVVNDLGWLSRGPSRRANREADRHLAPMLLSDGEPSSLPPDPTEAPPLPEPPDQVPDVDQRGGEPDGKRAR